MIRYLGLGEYFWLAEQVTGVEAAVLAKARRVDLADSALHAPAAGFEDDDPGSDPTRASARSKSSGLVRVHTITSNDGRQSS
ncbi:MAG: hypothetical protein JJU45_04715 [Acidimicrobiia bacterium]|nr:hypothetical protein [Acidimicrobiia bacterium]